MSVQTEFSRYAEHYGQYNLIQQQVARKLVDDLQGEHPQNILDLGCGSGTLYEHLGYMPLSFTGVDFAPRMLELHPKSDTIECLYGDFNDPSLFDQLQIKRFDRIFSASALQWAKDIDQLFASIASLGTPVSLAIFSANTFKTLLETAGLEPLLKASSDVETAARRYFDASVEVVDYRLAFDSTREMFRYIKRSGVSGGRNILGYKETRQLMERYPLDYLEFEVVFIRS
jgi:malonyl-CoA O-methyltransferase